MRDRSTCHYFGYLMKTKLIATLFSFLLVHSNCFGIDLNSASSAEAGDGGEALVREASSHSAEPSATDIEFFETKVRPLLHDRCFECHGAKTQWGGLRVDSFPGLIKGGDTGPAIVPGDVEASLLIHSVRREGDYDMPPENPLSTEEVNILELWISKGAPWPKEEMLATGGGSSESHWSFQPVSKPDLPVVEQVLIPGTEQGSGVQPMNPIDRFIRSKLQTHGLDILPNADKRTLIRRLTYSLTGLPPTIEEVENFLNDPSENAYELLVDRLLGTKQYGEHWARYWLDLARYADTKGYVYGFESSTFVHASAYRDWVINAFCSDMPYDRFLLLQIAADQAEPQNLDSQAAMGFMTVGRRFLGNEHDIIDDRMDVLGRTSMGLTFGCARCHDHKYDPIPITDYYSLYGVIANSIEELIPLSPIDALPDNLESEYQAKKKAYDDAFKHYADLAAQRMRDRFSDYLQAQLDLSSHPNVPFSQILQETDLFPAYVHQLDTYLRGTDKTQDPLFTAWHAFLALDDEEFATNALGVQAEIQSWSKERISPAVAKLFRVAPGSRQEVVDRYSELFQSVREEWKGLLASASEQGVEPPSHLADADREAVRLVLFGDQSPCLVPLENISNVGDYFPTSSDLHRVWEKQRELEQWILSTPGVPKFTVRLADRADIEEPRVFRRGNPNTKGAEVPRQLPKILKKETDAPFQQGSGRLELAQSITAQSNPLTSRVWVNRIWQMHFGSGLVPTASDFGVRSPKPEHAELLDWLAATLIENNWSTKAIQKTILLSDTFKQSLHDNATSSELNPEGSLPVSASSSRVPARTELAEEIDPQNQLFWKRVPHRLTFEEFRDSLLQSSGDLDRDLATSSGPLFVSTDTNRSRTVFGTIDRQSLPDAYRVFDFANPDMHVPQRSETMVSQQALFALNHPFLAQRAKSLVSKLPSLAAVTDDQRIQKIFEAVFQRRPTTEELTQSTEFLKIESETHQAEQLTDRQKAWKYGFGKLDIDNASISDFVEFKTFTNGTWQNGPTIPDPISGWAFLNAAGGHPGNDLNQVVVRRWTANASGKISIRSLANHEPNVGNGSRFWILASKQGKLQCTELFHSSKQIDVDSIEVNAGDSIDFVVDVFNELNSDQYLWEIDIEQTVEPNQGDSTVDSALEDSPTKLKWNSKQDFAGPTPEHLTPWEQFVQVLFLSNEFYFVP